MTTDEIQELRANAVEIAINGGNNMLVDAYKLRDLCDRALEYRDCIRELQIRLHNFIGVIDRCVGVEWP